MSLVCAVLALVWAVQPGHALNIRGESRVPMTMAGAGVEGSGVGNESMQIGAAQCCIILFLRYVLSSLRYFLFLSICYEHLVISPLHNLFK